MNSRNRVSALRAKAHRSIGALAVCTILLAGCGPGEADRAALAQQQQEIERLRQENSELPKLKAEYEEVQRLKKENQDIFKLRAQYNELLRLRKENEQLQNQLSRLEQNKR